MAKFQTTILTSGKTATGICIPDDIIEKLGSGKKPPVKVTLNGYTYRSTVAVMGGKYMVGVNAGVREAAGVAGGDKLTVEIELDTEERKFSIPAAIKKELYEVVSYHSGQDVEKIEKDFDRDFWMTALEAKEYGLVDEVLLINPKKQKDK